MGGSAWFAQLINSGMFSGSGDPTNDDVVDRWMLHKTFLLQDCVDDDVSLNVVPIIGGFVYLSTFCKTHPSSCQFMCFFLETEELDYLHTLTHSDISYPYVMAFLPSLACNKVSPQPKEA